MARVKPELEAGEVRLEKKEEKEEEQESYTRWENIYFGLLWVGVTAIMIWFVVQIAAQLSDAVSSPPTIISFDTVTDSALPKVTICNWNQIVAPYDPCDFCDLQMVLCSDIASGSDCYLDHMQIAAKNISDGVFNCYQFNGDPNNPATSSLVGYVGSFSALFVVSNPPEDDTLRIGLQVSLNTMDEEPDVFNEDKFAPPGFDSYFAIQTVNTAFMNNTPPTYDTNYVVSYSTTAIVRKNNETHSYISVSWAFQTLNVETISYIPQYTLNNFFGDFAGMVGTLMGLDVVKVVSGIRVAVGAYRSKNVFPLQDHFNG